MTEQFEIAKIDYLAVLKQCILCLFLFHSIQSPPKLVQLYNV